MEVMRPSIFQYFVDTVTAGTRGKNAQNKDNVVSNIINTFHSKEQLSQR